MKLLFIYVSIIAVSLDASLAHTVYVNGFTKTPGYSSFSDNRLAEVNRERQTFPMKPYSSHEQESGEEGLDCTRMTATLTCQKIPEKVPRGISRVVVSAPGQPIHIAEHQFSDMSWTRVGALVIEGDEFNLQENNQFIGLANLSSLYLNGSDIDFFKRDCFAGLDTLKSLTLTGMLQMDGASLQLALANTSVLQKLKFFAIRPGQTYKSSFMRIEKFFIRRLIHNKLQVLNISNTIMEIKTEDLAKFIIGSRPFDANFSGSFLILNNFYPEYKINEYRYVSDDKPWYRVLDISNSRNVIVSTNSNSELADTSFNTTGTFGKHFVSYLFLLVETLYANNIYKDYSEFQGLQNYSSYKMFMTRIVFTGNYVPIMNATCILPPNNTLHYVDFSNNKVEYIGRGSSVSMCALKELNLSNNRLFHMEKNPEFAAILTTLKSLIVFNMATNKLSFIPPTMFLSNLNLATLILSSNRLTSISFSLGHLTKLRQLDLRDNLIASLGDSELTSVQMIFQDRRGQLDALFEGNPIECSCQNVRFISLLVTLREASKEQVTCSYEGDTVDVNNDAVGKCNYLCKRVMIISLSITSGLVCVVVLVTVGLKIRRMKERKKKKNMEWQLRESVQAGNFVSFTAVAGNDEAVVNEVLLRNLRRLLQAKVGLDTETVCTGNMFRPGFSICEEAYRLLKQCPVFVGVVSESFLGSQYCRLELQEACKQNKPTILVFLGHVDTEEMPPYMQEVFRRTSRAWIRQTEQGYYYLVPNIRLLGEAVWDLACSV